MRPPSGFATAGPYNPYVEVIEALKKFDAQPLGRRAILLVSDGLDISRGVDSSAPTQSIDLQRAVNESQRRSVAIYGFYAPTQVAAANPILIANAQSSLLRLSNETGGMAFFQGTGAPVSFDTFHSRVGCFTSETSRADVPIDTSKQGLPQDRDQVVDSWCESLISFGLREVKLLNRRGE